MIAAWQQQNFPGGSSGGTALNSVFNISTSCGGAKNCLQWKYDDSTDNCGAATTAFMVLVNAAGNGAGTNLYIGGGTAGTGAYLLQTCSLSFSGNQITVNASATFDAGTNSGANLIQFGNGSGGIYRWTGGAFIGGASLTVAGMETLTGVGNAVIDKVSWESFGAGNATLGSCTNYAITFDNFMTEATVSNNLWQSYDTTNGRCFINNAGITAGSSTLYTFGNVISGASPTHCASVGITDGGYYGTLSNNNIGNIASPILLKGQGHRIEGNQLDTEGCTTGAGASALIASAGLVDAVSFVNNVGQFGAGHAVSFFQVVSGTISNFSFVGNSQSGTSQSSPLIGGASQNCGLGGTNSNPCYEYANTSLGSLVTCGTTNTGWQFGTILASCSNSAQTANVGSTLLFTPGITQGTVVSCIVSLTTAAGTSSTLPQCVIAYTDAFSNAAQTLTLTPVWASGTAGCSGSTTNTLGNSCAASSGVIAPKAATAVNYSTTGYASNAAATMQYTVLVRANTQ